MADDMDKKNQQGNQSGKQDGQSGQSQQGQHAIRHLMPQDWSWQWAVSSDLR